MYHCSIWQEQLEEVFPDPEPAKLVLQRIDGKLFHKDTTLFIEKLEKRLQNELRLELAGPLGKLEGFENTLQQFNNEREELQNSLMRLRNNTFVELKKLHEEELFPRIERNVEGYLNWYYSITGEYVRMGNLIAGNFEQHMKDKLSEYLTRNIDVQKAERMIRHLFDESGKIAAQMAAVERMTQQLLTQVAEVSEEVARMNEAYQIQWQQEVDAVIAENEVSPPADMSAVIIEGDYASVDDFMESFQGISVEVASVMERFEVYTNAMHDLLRLFTHHSSEYVSFRNRMTLSTGIGVAGLGRGAYLGARMTASIASKPVFKEAVEIVVKQIIKRSTGIGSGAVGGAAVGGSVGSVVPVVGTAAGAVMGGIAGGTAAWLATDYVLIKLEEYISRESFKREILYGINEQKAEVMRTLEDMFRINQ